MSGRGEVTNTNDESFRNDQLQLTNSDSFEHSPDQDVDLVFIKKGKAQELAQELTEEALLKENEAKENHNQEVSK